jgi:hypothetical protein
MTGLNAKLKRRLSMKPVRQVRTQPQRGKTFQKLWILMLVLFAGTGIANSQKWVPLTHQPTFSANTAILRTDGGVIVQDFATQDWWLLTPDSNGNYRNGTWSQLASMPSGYGPYLYASAVLPDDRLLVEGGEYNEGMADWTNRGAIYDEKIDQWESVSPPSGWSTIGNTQSVVLANGKFMISNCCVKEAAIWDAKTQTWSSTGTGKADSYSYEGWTLLPSGNVLTVDVSNGTESELYNPSTGKWSLAGSTVVPLVACEDQIGPAVLRPDGTVFAVGANGNTAIYNSSSGKWSEGPTFPKNGEGQQLAVPSGPAALLPDGNVLVDTSPVSTSDCGAAGSKFFEFNGKTLTHVPAPPNAPNDPSYVGRMLVLPDATVLFTDTSNDVELYVPKGSPKKTWAPNISSYPHTVTRGDAYVIKGTQFNGLSQGAMYGNFAQMATNYPLVRIKNSATKHEFYCRTTNFSSMGVATRSEAVSFTLVIPSNAETGSSTLVVVTNGIQSKAVDITVQ